MAVKEFNMNKIKRTFWPFTLKDADTSTIYNLVAAVLNNNMGNVKVSAEEVESYDIEECTAILNAYMEFVDELKANPN